MVLQPEKREPFLALFRPSSRVDFVRGPSREDAVTLAVTLRPNRRSSAAHWSMERKFPAPLRCRAFMCAAAAWLVS